MTTRTEVKKYGLLIDGEWRQPVGGDTTERRSPADQSLVAVLPLAGESDLDLAVAAARRAFDAGEWSANVTHRARILRGAAARIRAERETLVPLLAREVGKTLSEATGEILALANTLDAYAGLGESANGRAIVNATGSAIGMILKEPVGVAGLIVPWNWPLVILGWKLGAALAAGCTVVIKPSIYTGATTYEIARILTEAGAPPGVVNVVTGRSSIIGDKFVTHAGIDKISFTGSTATGRHIMTLAAGDIKRISLELGGKSPNIVFADANLGAAAAGAIGAAFLNAGQTCQAGTRLLLQRSIYDEFMAQFLAFVDRMKVGDPLDPATNMGPLVSEEQLDIVLGYVEVGKNEGARLLRGGERLTGPEYDKGFYMRPTVLDAVDNKMRIAQEEIFGPVVVVIPFEDEDEALAIANDSVYGLAAGVWSNNLRTVMRLSRGLKAGTVWVNCFHSCGISNVPFGGYKQSGLGREQGLEGVEAFLETKSVHINHG